MGDEGSKIMIGEHIKKEVGFMKIVSLKCPECKADISLDDEKEFGFCQYCGTKILFQNENKFIYKNIDEAKIKQAETDRLIKIKQIEIDEKQKT